MRHAHYKLLPHRERPRHRVAAKFPAVYAQARRRRRRLLDFNALPSIAGLKLWLDAGNGALSAWSDAPSSGWPWIDYSSSAGYTANGSTHTIRIYPFKTVSSQVVYSANFLDVQIADDSSSQLYYVNWNWNPVAGAEGYRVLKSDTGSGLNFDYYLDVVGAESFVDTGTGMFTAGPTVLPWNIGAGKEGEPVVQLTDQSGLGNHATQNTIPLCATFKSVMVNGRPALRFGSSAGYATPLALNAPCTVFAVYALNGAGNLARRAVQGSANWLIGPYGPPHEFYNGGGFTGGQPVVRGRFVAQAAWQNGSVSRNFVNGSFVGATLGGGTGPGTLGLGIVGAFSEGLDGDLAEVIAYDSALSTTNLANVWAYLATKYQLY